VWVGRWGGCVGTTKKLIVVFDFCTQFVITLLGMVLITALVCIVFNILVFHWPFGVWFGVVVLGVSVLVSLIVTIVTFEP